MYSHEDEERSEKDAYPHPHPPSDAEEGRPLAADRDDASPEFTSCSIISTLSEARDSFYDRFPAVMMKSTR